jgi:hypothetical protein
MVHSDSYLSWYVLQFMLYTLYMEDKTFILSLNEANTILQHLFNIVTCISDYRSVSLFIGHSLVVTTNNYNTSKITVIITLN